MTNKTCSIYCGLFLHDLCYPPQGCKLSYLPIYLANRLAVYMVRLGLEHFRFVRGSKLNVISRHTMPTMTAAEDLRINRFKVLQAVLHSFLEKDCFKRLPLF
jgi:hypothetical protein